MLAETDYEKLVTDEASTTVTYIGYAQDAYALKSSPVWCILRITASSASTPTGVSDYQWAPSKGNFTAVWDDRAALTYV